MDWGMGGIAPKGIDRPFQGWCELWIKMDLYQNQEVLVSPGHLTTGCCLFQVPPSSFSAFTLKLPSFTETKTQSRTIGPHPEWSGFVSIWKKALKEAKDRDWGHLLFPADQIHILNRDSWYSMTKEEAQANKRKGHSPQCGRQLYLRE